MGSEGAVIKVTKSVWRHLQMTPTKMFRGELLISVRVDSKHCPMIERFA